MLNVKPVDQTEKSRLRFDSLQTTQWFEKDLKINKSVAANFKSVIIKKKRGKKEGKKDIHGEKCTFKVMLS